MKINRLSTFSQKTEFFGLFPGSRPFLFERSVGVFPGRAREPPFRLLRAWTGENPLQPRIASHSKHPRRPPPDCQCGYP